MINLTLLLLNWRLLLMLRFVSDSIIAIMLKLLSLFGSTLNYIVWRPRHIYRTVLYEGIYNIWYWSFLCMLVIFILFYYYLMYPALFKSLLIQQLQFTFQTFICKFIKILRNLPYFLCHSFFKLLFPRS